MDSLRFVAVWLGRKEMRLMPEFASVGNASRVVVTATGQRDSFVFRRLLLFAVCLLIPQGREKFPLAQHGHMLALIFSPTGTRTLRLSVYWQRGVKHIGDGSIWIDSTNQSFHVVHFDELESHIYIEVQFCESS